MMLRSTVLLAAFILGGSTGEIAITHGMKSVGEPVRLRPRFVLHFLGRAVRNRWFWTGVPLLAFAFYALLVLLSCEALGGRVTRMCGRGAGSRELTRPCGQDCHE